MNVLNNCIHYHCIALSTIHNWEHWRWNSLVMPVSKFWTIWNVHDNYYHDNYRLLLDILPSPRFKLSLTRIFVYVCANQKALMLIPEIGKQARNQSDNSELSHYRDITTLTWKQEGTSLTLAWASRFFRHISTSILYKYLFTNGDIASLCSYSENLLGLIIICL